MKYFIVILALLASCQKAQVDELVLMPDLLQYNSNTNAVRMHEAPGIPLDTLLYFQDHIYTMAERPNETGGTNRYIACSGPYSLNVTALTVDWTQGPLRGRKEVLQPIKQVNGFTKLQSKYREFWIKSE